MQIGINLIQSIDVQGSPHLSHKVSPVLLCAFARTLLEHHVFCCMAWELSGVTLLWPVDSRWATGMMNMDWWNILSMSCYAPTFYGDDSLYFAVVSVPFQLVLFTYFVGLFFTGRLGIILEPQLDTASLAGEPYNISYCRPTIGFRSAGLGCEGPPEPQWASAPTLGHGADQRASKWRQGGKGVGINCAGDTE